MGRGAGDHRGLPPLVTAILTAWCGFEASKWGGRMSIDFSQASSDRIRSVDLASESRDAQAVDLAIYSSGSTRGPMGDPALAEYYHERFTREFAVAFADREAGGEGLASPFAEPSFIPRGARNRPSWRRRPTRSSRPPSRATSAATTTPCSPCSSRWCSSSPRCRNAISRAGADGSCSVSARPSRSSAA